jgi:DNA-binding HxlR family transcriptional regulator
MGWSDYDSQVCSIARASELLGDRWTLLVLRDLQNGVHRFDELHRHLGIARDVLARRLERLVASGLAVRVEYHEPGSRTRHEYQLTDAGRELRTVLVALLEWGDRHLAGAEGAPMAVRHETCGATARLQLVCDRGHRLDPDADLTLVPLPAARLVG